MTDEEKVKDFLGKIKHIVLAVTLDDGTPWAVPVTVLDRNGYKEFMWDSKLDTVHSQAISKHPDVAVTMFDKAINGEMGVYMKGKAKLIEDKGNSFGRYSFTAEKVWVNDESFVKREVNL